MAQFGDLSALNRVIAALDDHDNQDFLARSDALLALSNVKANRATEVLLKAAASDSDEGIRYFALIYLLDRREPRAGRGGQGATG